MMVFMLMFHTHGLRENLNRQDLRIILNMDPEVAHDVFCSIVEEVLEGKNLNKGLSIRFIEGNPVIMKSVIELDREIKKIYYLMKEAFFLL